MAHYYLVKREPEGKISMNSFIPTPEIREKLTESRPVLTGKRESDKRVRTPVFVVLASDRRDALEKFENYIRIPVHA